MIAMLMAVMALLTAQAPKPAPDQKTVPSQATMSPAAADALVGPRWRLAALGDVRPDAKPGARVPHLEFAGSGSFVGSDGCNTIRGGIGATDDTITFRAILGTLMTCSLPDKLDTRFREALGNARTWKVEAGTLTFFDDKGATIVRFDRTP